jgi:hypothetical protein
MKKLFKTIFTYNIFKKASSRRAWKIALTGCIIFWSMCLISIFIHKLDGIFFIIPWLVGMGGILYGQFTYFMDD